MRALTSFRSEALAETLLVLALAFLFGGAIGLERQVRQRTAGLRTNVLVAVGAAGFVDLGMNVFPPAGSAQIIAYVVAGIGFLGAGVIMKEGAQVRGLNTAATLWCSAAVGACAGAGFVAQAAALTAFVLAGNTLLRPLVNAINRQPMDEKVTEALYQVHLVCDLLDLSEARDLLFETLEGADYPIQNTQTLLNSEDVVELSATLAVSSADAEVLDKLVEALDGDPRVRGASWSVGAES